MPPFFLSGILTGTCHMNRTFIKYNQYNTSNEVGFIVLCGCQMHINVCLAWGAFGFSTWKQYHSLECVTREHVCHAPIFLGSKAFVLIYCLLLKLYFFLKKNKNKKIASAWFLVGVCKKRWREEEGENWFLCACRPRTLYTNFAGQFIHEEGERQGGTQRQLSSLSSIHH